MRALFVVLTLAASAAPIAARAEDLPPSDFGLTFSAASTTSVSTVTNPANVNAVAGNIVSQHVTGTADHPADVKASTYTVTADDGFLFKQGVSIQGNGSASSTTTLTLTFTNTQAIAQDIRFDSFIIPGHFGFRQIGADSLQAAIDFQVSLPGQLPLFETHYNFSNDPQRGNYMAPLFSTYVTGTNNNALNGTSYYNSSYFGSSSGQYNFANARDWWDHRFYLDLGLFQPGESKVLTYASTVSASIAGTSCTDLSEVASAIQFNSSCSAVDVSFGDPTIKGGVIGLARASSAITAQPGSPIVGYANDPFFVDLRAYQTDRPEHPQDTPPFTPNYDAPTEAPAGVPEPATWALMLGGFGTVGAMMRRRKAVLA